MKFKLSTPIFDAALTKMLEMSGSKLPPEPPTFQTLLSQLLIGGGPDERPAPDEKVKRYTILNKLLNATHDQVDLTVDDLTVLKKIVDIGCPTLTHGRVMAILNAPESGKQG